MLVPKLPILAPRRSRHVPLLSLSLNVGLLVLRRIEHRLSLLRRHTGDGLGRRRRIRTGRGRRTGRILTASTAAAPAPAATTTAASALLLAKRQLVIPARVGIGDGDLENLLVPEQRAVEPRVGRVLGAPALDEIVQTQIE